MIISSWFFSWSRYCRLRLISHHFFPQNEFRRQQYIQIPSLKNHSLFQAFFMIKKWLWKTQNAYLNELCYRQRAQFFTVVWLYFFQKEDFLCTSGANWKKVNHYLIRFYRHFIRSTWFNAGHILIKTCQCVEIVAIVSHSIHSPWALKFMLKELFCFVSWIGKIE